MHLRRFLRLAAIPFVLAALMDCSTFTALSLAYSGQTTGALTAPINTLSLWPLSATNEPFATSSTAGFGVDWDGSQVVVLNTIDGAGITRFIKLGDRIMKLNGIAATKENVFHFRNILHDPKIKTITVEYESDGKRGTATVSKEPLFRE